MFNKQKIPFFLLAGLNSLAGGVGSILYLIFYLTYGPTVIRNQLIGFYLCLIFLFFSIQSIYLLSKKLKFIINGYFYADLFYYLLTTILAFLIMVFYCFTGKIDAIIWSLLVFLTNTFNCLILMTRRKLYHKSIDDSVTITMTKSDAIDFYYHTRDEKPETCLSNVRRVVNIFFKVIFLIILALILAGSVVIGNGYTKYPARGQFSQVKLNDNSGRELKVHFLCDGPRNDSLPIFLFDGSGSHVMADYFGLQIVLKERGRRSCIFDPPGQGYSDDVYNDIKTDYKPFYHNMIKSFGETEPFVMVGWGAGGVTMYEYASEHPDMVHSLTFLDTYPTGIEFRTPFVLKNWTQAQLDNYKKSELAARSFLMEMINAFAVPFGLMGLFIPESKSYPPERREEVRWYFLSDRTWATQRHYFRFVNYEEDIFETIKIDPSIPINVFVSVKSDQQVIDITCKDMNLEPESDECKYEIEANKYSINERVKLGQLTPAGGEVVECTFDDCSQGYFVDNPQFTVEKLLTIYK